VPREATRSTRPSSRSTSPTSLAARAGGPRREREREPLLVLLEHLRRAHADARERRAGLREALDGAGLAEPALDGVEHEAAHQRVGHVARELERRDRRLEEPAPLVGAPLERGHDAVEAARLRERPRRRVAIEEAVRPPQLLAPGARHVRHRGRGDGEDDDLPEQGPPPRGARLGLLELRVRARASVAVRHRREGVGVRGARVGRRAELLGAHGRQRPPQGREAVDLARQEAVAGVGRDGHERRRRHVARVAIDLVDRGAGLVEPPEPHQRLRLGPEGEDRVEAGAEPRARGERLRRSGELERRAGIAEVVEAPHREVGHRPGGERHEAARVGARAQVLEALRGEQRLPEEQRLHRAELGDGEVEVDGERVGLEIRDAPERAGEELLAAGAERGRERGELGHHARLGRVRRERGHALGARVHPADVEELAVGDRGHERPHRLDVRLDRGREAALVGHPQRRSERGEGGARPRVVRDLDERQPGAGERDRVGVGPLTAGDAEELPLPLAPLQAEDGHERRPHVGVFAPRAPAVHAEQPAHALEQLPAWAPRLRRAVRQLPPIHRQRRHPELAREHRPAPGAPRFSDILRSEQVCIHLWKDWNVFHFGPPVHFL
jgi:hypothetical protein